MHPPDAPFRSPAPPPLDQPPRSEGGQLKVQSDCRTSRQKDQKDQRIKRTKRTQETSLCESRLQNIHALLFAASPVYKRQEEAKLEGDLSCCREQREEMKAQKEEIWEATNLLSC